MDGGAICVTTSSNVIAKHDIANRSIGYNLLRYNNASRYGGAIFVSDRGSLDLSSRNSIQIENNTALKEGGVIYVSQYLHITPPRQRYFCHPTEVEWLQILL